MELCFIVSGIPRTFYNNLHLFFIELNKIITFDVYINFSEYASDNIYTNKEIDLISLNNFSFYKTIIITHDIQFNKAKKEQNILNQWNRIQILYNTIKKSYTHYIRIRPDLKLLIDPIDFIKLITELDNTKLHIPNGYDFYNSYHLTNDNNCINDQIAIGNKELMYIYCNFFDYIKLKNDFISSEKELFSYLIYNNILINRIILPYKLILSECKVISIAGDSGSGKSTLVSALESLLFDSSITIETDRYHKWERTSDMWNKYTHLHPEANYLEKMSEDVFRLKLGETIFSVDYDHNSGKFTEPQKIESKPFLLLCGLHTLYQEKIRNIAEIKIFLDVDFELKKEWKIKRDIKERNHSLESVLKNLEKRKLDFINYIEPQKIHSNIIIEYNNKNNFIIHINNELNYYINPFLCQISIIKTNIYNDFYSYIIDETKITDSLFNIFIKNQDIINKLKHYPLNIIQASVYLCLFND